MSIRVDNGITAFFKQQCTNSMTLPHKEESEKLIDDWKYERAEIQQLKQKVVLLQWLAISCCCCLLISLGFLIATKLGTTSCAVELSTYSPALTAVEYYEYQWPNAFDEVDKYRGPPTPERDAAWKGLWQMGDIVIKTQELQRLNKSTEAAMSMINPRLNGIPANLEAFHQLHCLDMIRRYTYLHTYTSETLPVDLQDTPDTYMRDHIDHCITTLRLAIMCTSDVTPILMERDHEDVLNVNPDMRTTHKCRRFEKVQEWFLANAYTDYDCILREGQNCSIIPSELQETKTV